MYQVILSTILLSHCYGGELINSVPVLKTSTETDRYGSGNSPDNRELQILNQVVSSCIGEFEFVLVEDENGEDFNDARQACQSAGNGDLASIPSAEVNAFVIDFLDDSRNEIDAQQTWIGLSTSSFNQGEISEPSNYRFRDGTEFEDNFAQIRGRDPWASDNPTFSSDRCVVYGNGERTWQNVDCNNFLSHYLCKRDCSTDKPTLKPTPKPTRNPTTSPTKTPTKNPTPSPSKNPTNRPTLNPTKNPTPSEVVDVPSPNPTPLDGTPPDTTPTSSPVQSSDSSGSNFFADNGIFVGAGAGGLVFLSLILFAVIFVGRKRQQKKAAMMSVEDFEQRNLAIKGFQGI